MSQLSRHSLLWVSIILFCCLSLAGYFYILYSQKNRIEVAQVRWEAIQKKATAQGIYTDFDTFIEATAGEGPSLFTDFSELSSLFDPEDRTRPFSVDQLPGLKNIPSISATMSRAERIEELRECLTTHLPETATEQELYQAVLSAISPLNEELDKWKTAVFASNNLGKEYFKENFFFISATTFRSFSDLLLLRTHCSWHIGKTDSSDIKCVLKSSQLLYDYGQSLIALTVAIALDLSTSNTIAMTLNDPIVSNAQCKSLITLMPTIDATAAFTSGLQTEYIVQLSALTAFVESSDHPFIDKDEPLRNTPKHLLEEARVELAEFQLDSYFGPNSVTSKSVFGKVSDQTQANIEAADLGEISTTLLSVLSIGSEYYHHKALKSQLHLEAAKLSAYVTLYQRKHGNYPETLDALVPEYLRKLPTTPYTGSDFIYTKPITADEIPTISAVISIRQAENITAQWPEAKKATP